MMDDIRETDKYIKKMVCNYKEEIVALCLFMILSFFFLLDSPLHPWTNRVTHVDSSVFKTVALMMQKGYMPYKDSFDHKGPLLYIINWLGNQISYYRGVWIFEFLFMICTFYFVYKIARLSVKPLSAGFTILISLSLLFRYFRGGNFTEEYAMPFIAVGTYIFLDYLKNDVITVIRLMGSGFCFGAVILLRPNMIALWIVFCMSVLVNNIVKKHWRQTGRFVIWFLTGMAVILVPVMMWLAVNGALKQCWEDYIVFNMQYTSAEGGLALFPAKWNSFFTYLNTEVYIIALAGILYNIKKQLYLNITYFVYMIISLLFLCMSGMVLGHYGMVLVPLMAYPVSLIFEDMESIENTEISRAVGVILCAYALSAIIIPDWIELVKDIPVQYEAKEEDHLAQACNGITDIITSYTDSDDAISVYGNLDCIYVLSQRKHATRYSYQFPVGQVMPEIMNEFMSELSEELPTVIVVQEGHMDDNISAFLTQNNYSFVWGQNGGQENGGTLLFHRQK